MVIFSNPAEPEVSIAVLDGGLSSDPNVTTINYASPIDKTLPGFSATMALGISFSAQDQSGPGGSHLCATDSGMSSIVDVNGQRLTSCAGNLDDGVGTVANGILITVGGVGDNTLNPADPFQEPADGKTPRVEDDELYDLAPFLNTGDTQTVLNTQNPSGDDQIFLLIAKITAKATFTTEVCDDGIDNDGDGLIDSNDPDCAPPGPVCGNNVVETGEQCDDGNTTSGDGCSATCQTEFCGDGIVQPGLGEECDDGANGDNGDGCTDSCLINFDPDCSAAVASPAALWPPNHKGVNISIVGVTDPDGNPLTITPTSVFQDEQVSKVTGDGAGATSPDASLSPLQVRAERNGNPKTPGDGRVYHISFTADDGVGGSCTGEVLVCVPHDQGGSPTCIDEGPLYNSLLP